MQTLSEWGVFEERVENKTIDVIEVVNNQGGGIWTSTSFSEDILEPQERLKKSQKTPGFLPELQV